MDGDTTGTTSQAGKPLERGLSAAEVYQRYLAECAAEDRRTVEEQAANAARPARTWGKL